MKKYLAQWVVYAALLMVPLYACGSTGLPAVSGLSLRSAAAPMVSHTIVPLHHAPTGSVHLTWNASQQTLTVAMQVVGLTPGSVHPTHLHAGTCQAPGRILFSLPTLRANQGGQASMRTVIHQVARLPQAWVVNVHNGPTMTPPVQSLALACGTLTAKTKSTTPGTFQESIALFGTNAPNESASGSADLTFSSGGLLTVTVSVHGLAPGSRHAAHIHLGRCSAQGTMLYPLTTLIGNAHGEDRETTTLHGVTLPSLWYINVHWGDMLTTPQGQVIAEQFNPIACGNSPPAFLKRVLLPLASPVESLVLARPRAQ
jgi:hypothetical protein